MPTDLADRILETMRRSLGLSIRVTEPAGDGREWRIEAASAAGERWVASHEDDYKAAVMLAALVGFDLFDG